MSWHPLHEFVAPVPVTHAVLPEESMTFGNLTARVAQAARRWVWSKNSGWFFYTIYMYNYTLPETNASLPTNGWLRDFLVFLLRWRNLAGDMVSFREGIWFRWRCYPWAVSKNIWTGKILGSYMARQYMGVVSKNSDTPKSSILIGFSIIYHPFWGTPILGNTHIYRKK